MGWVHLVLLYSRVYVIVFEASFLFSFFGLLCFCVTCFRVRYMYNSARASSVFVPGGCCGFVNGGAYPPPTPPSPYDLICVCLDVRPHVPGAVLSLCPPVFMCFALCFFVFFWLGCSIYSSVVSCRVCSYIVQASLETSNLGRPTALWSLWTK